MRDEFSDQTHDVAMTLVGALRALVRAGAPPSAVHLGAALAMGNLVQELVAPEHVEATLEGLAKAARAAAHTCALMRQPPAGQA